jgi:ATP-dependent RNA helicase RhlE
MPFKTLKLIQPLLQAVQSEGYTIPTEIQTQAIPHVLEGRDLMGCAQTGTGKTAAFALPILQRLWHGRPAHELPSVAQAFQPVHARPGKAAPPNAGAPGGARPIRALVMTPTRELAAQIGESFRVYGQHIGLRHTVVFGGVKQGPQTLALHRGVDILVATPGRLLDLLNQRLLTLSSVQVLVLDEADRMLDMGFIHDIRRVIALLPAKRQTLMFSATMPRDIRTLANTLLVNPVFVKVAAESPAADTVKQALYFVDHQSKPALLEHLLQDPQISRALVFTRTKHGADKVVRRLLKGAIGAEAIHSNKSQNARIRALANFKAGKTRVLVASDIAARGLDVDDISHVINYDLPNVAETYVHRIGRTGRAGARGQAISFCSEEQRDDLREIERLLGKPIPTLPHSIKASPQDIAEGQSQQRHGQQRGQQRGHGSRHGGHAPQGTAAPHKSATPTQQKDEFWRSKRKPGTGWNKPKFRGRGR